MAEDDALTVIVEFAEGNEASALDDSAIRSGNGEALRVGEDARLFFSREHALSAPVGEVARRSNVEIGAALAVDAGGPVEEFGQAEDNAHEVVGATLVVGLLHGGRDFVIRLRDNIFKADPRWIVTERSEGIDAGHAAAVLQGAGMDGAGCFSRLLCGDCKPMRIRELGGWGELSEAASALPGNANENALLVPQIRIETASRLVRPTLGVPC